MMVVRVKGEDARDTIRFICAKQRDNKVQIQSSHDAFLCLFPKSAQFEVTTCTRRDYTAEHVQYALCAGGDGHTVPRHCGTDVGVADEFTGTLWMGWNLGVRRGTSESEASFLLRMGEC
jgi:hypothetical protein